MSFRLSISGKRNRRFGEHLTNPTIVPIVAELMHTDTVRVWHDQIQVKPPRIGGPTIWHQDHPYWPVIQPADLVSAWVALEDATIENGCMSMIEGQLSLGAVSGRHHRQPSRNACPDARSFLYSRGRDRADGSHSGSSRACRVSSLPDLARRTAQPHRHQSARHRRPLYARPYALRAAGGQHLVEHHIHVAPGEVLTGDHFPTVYENGHRASHC